jgi:hypothetical protein
MKAKHSISNPLHHHQNIFSKKEYFWLPQKKAEKAPQRLICSQLQKCTEYTQKKLKVLLTLMLLNRVKLLLQLKKKFELLMIFSSKSYPNLL